MELFENLRKIFAAKAGDVNKVIQVDIEKRPFPNVLKHKEKEIHTSSFRIFHVEGESMAISRIYSDDYILVEELEDLTNLKQNETIVLHIESSSTKVQEYKLRKFIMIIDLELEQNALFELVLKIDMRSQFEGNKERFIKKLTDFKNKYQNNKAILSVTYKEGERDYSFHSFDKLYGVVKYKVIKDEEGKPSFLEEIRTNNDDAINFTQIVNHLSTKHITRFFYGISDEQATIILAQIFKTAQSHIRLVSNKLSEQITGNDLYKSSLKNFLNRDNVKLDIFIYEYKESNPIFDLLRTYKEKITVKTNSQNIKFTLNNKIINFCVGDDLAFRLETDIDSRLSECNFNDKTTCSNLTQQFDSIFNNENSNNVI